MMHASQNLVTYLKRHEGFRATPYADSAGVPTVGYGHVLTAAERARRALRYLTEPQAEALLREDLATRALWLNGINANLRQPLNQHQFDGVLSFVFNVGLTAFEQSTLLKMIRTANFKGAAGQFDRWIYITDPKTGKKIALRGLIRRRRGDRAIFECGDYRQ